MTPMTPTNRKAAAAANARAARIALAVAGLFGELAVKDLVPAPRYWLATLAFAGISATMLRLPLLGELPGSTNRFRISLESRDATVRQLTASAVIVVPMLLLATRLSLSQRDATVATMALVVTAGQAIIVQTRRDATVGCVLAVILVAVAATFRPSPSLLFTLVPTMCAVAVTLALLNRGKLLDTAHVAAPRQGGIVAATAVPVAAAGVLAAMAFLVLPPSAHPQPRQATDGGRASSGAAAEAQARFHNLIGPIDLRARGHLGATPVFATDAASPAYWQGEIYDSFDGTTWLAPVSAVAWRQTQGGFAPSTGASPPAGAVVRVDAAVVLADGFGVVLAPGMPDRFEGGGPVVADGNGTAYLPEPLHAGSHYLVTSWRPPAADTTAAALRATAGADDVTGNSLQLPADLPPRVTALAATLVAGAPDRYDAVQAVEDYLRSHETYTLDSPLPARGEDAVDDFLFVSHTGFCEQFASAAVIMLRSAGIPARLVTGYVGGDTTQVAGERVFRGKDAHAWIQVYYPGVGWVDSDPTAGSTPATASAGQLPIQRLQRVLRDVPGGRLTLLLGLASALMLGSGVTWWWPRLQRRRQTRRRVSQAAPVLAAYLQLERLLERRDRAREPHETFAEMAHRLGGTAVSPTDVTAAMRSLERECYGGHPLPDAETAAAVAVFDRLRAAAASEPVALAYATTRQPGPTLRSPDRRASG